MATVIGTVTHTNSGTKPYNAKFGDGQTAGDGDYSSVGAAKKAVEQKYGRPLQWTRSDLPGNIESWVTIRL